MPAAMPFDPAVPNADPHAAAAEAAVVRKVAWRIVPLLSLGYLISYLDRSNIGIASLTMMAGLGMNAAQFGLAAGLFFLGYLAGELPSNMLQVRFGARRWLARIMISWGFVVVGMAFVSGPTSLYVLRILLGAAEAGFTPGAILYLAFWFPERFRARMFGLFLLAIPASVVLGAPISASLLYLDGRLGLAGWQWLFIVEGAPAVLLGLAFLAALPDTPEDARWLDEEERRHLKNALHRSQRAAADDGHAAIRRALRDPKVWLMGLFGTGMSAASYGIIFFLPQIIAGFGASHIQNGFLTTLPFIVGAAAMLAWSWHSDRTGERRWHAVAPLAVAAFAFLAVAVVDQPVAKMLALTVAAAATYMTVGVFWHFVPVYFSEGKHAAASVAIINMIGIAAGFFQPTIMGYIKETTGSFSGGFLFTSATALFGAIVGYVLHFRGRQAG